MRDDEREPHVGADSVDALRQQRDRLRMQLDAARHDLQQARAELAVAREIQESMSEKLHQLENVADAGAPRTRAKNSGTRMPRTAWRTRIRQRMSGSPDARVLRRDIQLLRESEWFDADWYLAEYADVANAGLDPAEHYVRFGAPEGRDPCADFSTTAYLHDHPDLLEANTNPLVHFLRSGNAGIR